MWLAKDIYGPALEEIYILLRVCEGGGTQSGCYPRQLHCHESSVAGGWCGGPFGFLPTAQFYDSMSQPIKLIGSGAPRFTQIGSDPPGRGFPQQP